MPGRSATIQLIDLKPTDAAEFQTLAERECRKLKDLAAIMIRFAMLQLRNGKVLSVSAMSDALFEDERCQELKRHIQSNG